MTRRTYKSCTRCTQLNTNSFLRNLRQIFPTFNTNNYNITYRTNRRGKFIQFYSVPVRAPDRGRITEDELAQQILKIMGTKADPRTPPVGILTTMKRPAWAKAREELLKRAYDCNFLACQHYPLISVS